MALFGFLAGKTKDEFLNTIIKARDMQVKGLLE
jgi:hypothetical protein